MGTCFQDFLAERSLKVYPVSILPLGITHPQMQLLELFQVRVARRVHHQVLVCWLMENMATSRKSLPSPLRERTQNPALGGAKAKPSAWILLGGGTSAAKLTPHPVRLSTSLCEAPPMSWPGLTRPSTDASYPDASRLCLQHGEQE